MGGLIKVDYDSYLDADMRAYIARSDGFYPPDAVSLTIEEQRAVYDRMCAAFHAGRPDSVAVSDQAMGGVPCRVYEAGATDVTVLYCHGGGFVVGGLQSHDDVCAELCARTGYRVVSVDYRLSPEHRHPAAYDDARAALDTVAATFDEKLILMGDSAGGNLAAALAHATRDAPYAPRVRGQLLIYPALGSQMDSPSYTIHANAPHLTASDIAFYKDIRGPSAPGDATAAPLDDVRFDGLPPTLISSAECDPISHDGRDYAAAIREAGGTAHWIEEAGLIHGHLRARHSVARAGAAFDRIVAGLQALGEGTWPYPD